MFIDWAPFAYDAETPPHNPLGGAQSAAVYLAAALADRGHDVVVINQIEQEKRSRGVLFTNLPKPTVWINGFDVIISVTGLRADTLRSIGCTRPVIAWCPHDVNQQAVASLSDPAQQALYAGFAMVSAWQKQEYIKAFGLPAGKLHVLRNAISPGFENRQRRWRWLEEGRPPTFAYISTPFRGLDALLMGFPLVRQAIPDARLRIHSGMQTYHRTEQDKLFNAIYELARVLPGVESTGPIGQLELADSLQRADILAYPNTFRETSCISVMEAAAAGLLVVTTNLGALPETCAGHARLVDAMTSGEQEFPAMFATRFAESVVAAYREAIADAAATSSRLTAQMNEFQTENTWAKRAGDWEAVLTTVCG